MSFVKQTDFFFQKFRDEQTTDKLYSIFSGTLWLHMDFWNIGLQAIKPVICNHSAYRLHTLSTILRSVGFAIILFWTLYVD